MTGTFPADSTESVSAGPLRLVWCADFTLVQLAHSYDASEMYGDNYGYRSGLNRSMVEHLSNKAQALERLVGLTRGDVALDIGSNDGTLLSAYQTGNVTRVGIDPTVEKFLEYYPKDVIVSADFFSSDAVKALIGEKQARLITSIAMFYDLKSPMEFAAEVARIMAPDGIWHFEQSYMPSMLRSTSYDTVCHEHVEYYSLANVGQVLKANGLEVVDVRFNAVNGGSFAVTAAHRGARAPSSQVLIDWFVRQEERMGLETPTPFRAFEHRVYEHRQDLTELVRRLRASGARVMGYGASTKGNVLLQFCGLTVDDIEAIAEVNLDKYGRVTPGTHIPIISEEQARGARPDYLLVLPWHFRAGIVAREAEYLKAGGRLIFPLPEIEIVGD